jgi:hypothetical protein
MLQTGTRLQRLRRLQTLGFKAQCLLNAGSEALTCQIEHAEHQCLSAKGLAASLGNQFLSNTTAMHILPCR